MSRRVRIAEMERLVAEDDAGAAVSSPMLIFRGEVRGMLVKALTAMKARKAELEARL